MRKFRAPDPGSSSSSNVYEFFSGALQISYECYSYPILLVIYFKACQKSLFISLQLVQCKYIKMANKKFFPQAVVHSNFYVCLYHYYFNLRKKFRVTCSSNRNAENQIWSFFYSLFLCYAGDSHAHTYTHIVKNVIFWIQVT